MDEFKKRMTDMTKREHREQDKINQLVKKLDNTLKGEIPSEKEDKQILPLKKMLTALTGRNK